MGVIMALICDYTTPGGLNATGAYHRISNINIDLRKRIGSNPTSCIVYWDIEISKDKDSRDEGKPLIGMFNASAVIDLTNTSANQFNIVKAGYEHLKTLSAYDGATDA